MRYTQVASDAFQHLQLNAGVILTEFNPESPGTPSTLKSKIAFATAGGAEFNSTPTYIDYGEDIDNIPANTKQMKRVQSYEPHLTGTAKTFNESARDRLLSCYTRTAITGGYKYVPNPELSESDFDDIWWVGDYSANNSNEGGGGVAIRIMNAINTGGFQFKSNDDGKGDFAFDFQGHYDIDDIDVVPWEVYVLDGEAEQTPDATLASLTLGSLTLSPTFDKNTTAYTASTTDATNTITATATDSSNATVEIKNGTTSVTSGNAATWSAGENTVTITVTNGTATKTYTVTVTKS